MIKLSLLMNIDGINPYEKLNVSSQDNLVNESWKRFPSRLHICFPQQNMITSS